MPISASDLLADLPRLRRYARFLIADPARADDLVEATLTRARRQGDKAPRGTSLRVHLLSLLRAAYAEQGASGRPHGSAAPAEQRTPPRAAGADAGRASDALADHARAQLAELHALPLEQREVIVLVAIERMSYDDIAALLRVPAATVIARLVEARGNLRGGTSIRLDAPQSGR